MATSKTSTTTKNEKAGIGLTLSPAASSYPIAYVEDTWDVAGTNSSLQEVMGGVGQYDQSSINETFAEKLSTLESSAASLTGCFKFKGVVTDSDFPSGVTSIEEYLPTLTSANYENGDVIRYIYGTTSAAGDTSQEWACLSSTDSSSTWELLGMQGGSEASLLAADGTAATSSTTEFMLVL